MLTWAISQVLALTGWLAFSYTPDQQVELTHIGIDIPSVNGDYQFQRVYSRDLNVVDDNTFRRDLFDAGDWAHRTRSCSARRRPLSLPSRPLSFSIPSSMVSGVLTGAGQQIVLAIDRLGDRRYCYINGGQFPFNGDVPPGEWRCGQPNVRVGIFGVINDDFVGAACDDGIQNGDETGVDQEAVVMPVIKVLPVAKTLTVRLEKVALQNLPRRCRASRGCSNRDRNAADYVETGFEFAHGPIIQVEDAMIVTHIGL